MWYYPTTQECQFIKLKLKSRVSNPTLFLLIIILKTKKAEFSVERRKTMVKKTEKNNFSIYSKKILNHLNSDRFAEQLLEFFESIRIKDVFETFQDFYINDYYSSKSISDYLKRSKVINILDYYRENFPKEYKYSDMREDSETKDFSRKFEKLVEAADLERNDNYSRICQFLEKFKKTQIGLDVETLELKLVKNSTEIPTLCDPDSDTNSKLDDTTQTIQLLNLINISSMNNLNYSSIEDKSHFNLLRYIAGIIEGQEFATELAKEIKENLRASKLSGKQLVYLTIYQPDFYIDGYSNLDDTHKKSMIRNILLDWSNDEIFTSRDLDINFIKNYFTDEEIFIAFKSRTKEILEAISSESTHPHFYDHNLIKLENGNYICVEDSSEPTSSDFSESQLSELKSEFIPILEKIQDVILVDYKGGNNKYILESIINPTLTKDKKNKSLLENLEYGDFLKWIFKLLDWFPSRFYLINKVSSLDLEDKNNPKIIKDNELYRFRREVASLLRFKGILEFAGADYVRCCMVEIRPASPYEYIFDSDEVFRKILKLSLGKDIDFLEYASSNLNQDVYNKRDLNIKGLNSPRIRI